MKQKEKNENSKVKKIIKTIIAIFGFLGTILTIYSVITQNKRPNVVCEILSDSNVFNINRDISDLVITYKEKNLQENKKQLSLIQLKFSNNGADGIRTDSFDISYPLTVKVLNGIIIDKPTLELTSNNYLEEVITFDVNDNEIRFPSFIFDEKDFFIFSFLVLCNEDDVHGIDVIGKIAKQKEIEVITHKAEVETLSFFAKVFKGNIFVQLVRLFFYSMITILFVCIITAGIVVISEKIEKYKRKKEIDIFVSDNNSPNNQTNKLIYNFYITENFGRLYTIYLCLNKNSKCISDYMNENLKKKHNKKDNIRPVVINRRRSEAELFLSLSLVIKDSEKKYVINKDQYKLLCNLTEYLLEGHPEREHMYSFFL